MYQYCFLPISSISPNCSRFCSISEQSFFSIISLEDAHKFYFVWPSSFLGLVAIAKEFLQVFFNIHLIITNINAILFVSEDNIKETSTIAEEACQNF